MPEHEDARRRADMVERELAEHDKTLSTTVRRVDGLERNHTDQAKTLTALVQDVSDLKLESALNKEREKARDEWRVRTEQKLDRIYNLGWWVLGTFGMAAMAMISRFMLSGGFNVPQ